MFLNRENLNPVSAANRVFLTDRHLYPDSIPIPILSENVSGMGFYEITCDNKKTIYSSPQIATMLGYSQDKWHENSRLLYESIHPDDLERISTDPNIAPDVNGFIPSQEYRLRKQNGREIWVKDTGRVIYDDEQRPVFVQGVIDDITEAKLNSTLNELVPYIYSDLEFDSVINRITEAMKQFIPYITLNIMLLADDGEHIQFSYSSGSSGYAKPLPLPDNTVDAITNLKDMRDTKKAIVNPDTEEAGSTWIPIPGREWIRSYLGAPIIVGGNVIGFVNLNHSQASFYEQTDCDNIQKFANLIGNAIVNAQKNQELQRLAKELEELSVTDHLTGLYNRRYFDEQLEKEVTRSQRHDNPLALIIIDIDDFKLFNDTFGHPEGDKRLKTIATLLQRSVRDIDICVRYGGEELAVILPDTYLSAAETVAERIREAAEKAIPKNGSEKVINNPNSGYTLSIGISSYPPDFEEKSTFSVENLILAADNALYAAKKEGKNRIVTASELDIEGRFRKRNVFIISPVES